MTVAKKPRGELINKLSQQHAYQEYIHTDSSDIYILTHCGHMGIQGSFMQELFNKLVESRVSVVMFNFSFIWSDTEVSPNMKREVSELWELYKETARRFPTKKIHLVGKSLGGIVASEVVRQHEHAVVSSITVFGYVPRRIHFGEYKGSVLIIQGSEDAFGGKEAVQRDIAKFPLKDSVVIELQGANHSLGDTKNPLAKHYSSAIELFVGHLQNS